MLALLLAWLLDLVLGDPAWLPHPVVGFGKMIAWGEHSLNKGRHRRLKGALMTLTLDGLVFLVAWAAMYAIDKSPWPSLCIRTGQTVRPSDLLSVVLIFYCLAGTTLVREVRQVFLALDRSLDEGRRQVGRIVGRDTSELSAQEIRTAALETLAENLSDGVIAPLFWLLVGGVPAMLTYKMINTQDSMIGYRTERYRDFGCWAARIDDVANYLPARLTSLLMVVAALFIPSLRGSRRGLSFVCKYGRNHASPNSGYPEAALAGILDCRFGGPHYYFGQLFPKPYIGTNDRPLTSADMRKSVRVNRMAEVLMLLLLFLCCGQARAGIRVTQLRTCDLRQPLGIDTPAPTFSWQVQSDERGFQQASYRITVAETDGPTVWDSGTVGSPLQSGIAYSGAALQSLKPYAWTVTVTGTDGQRASATSSFETAFLSASEWTGAWIHSPESGHVPYFGKNFSLPEGKAVRRARIYASALGVFTMTLNGRPVTDAVLEPGESEFEKTLLYSAYDVTGLLRPGTNTLLARVAGGLYDIDYLDGRFSKGEVRNNGQTALLSELHITYADGTSETIPTDGTWRTAPSPTLGSNWWGGEDYDARQRIGGLETATFDVGGWTPVAVLDHPSFASPHSGVSGFGTLRSRMYEPLRVVEEWPAVSVRTISSGGYTLRMVDFGRNFAGQYRFRLRGRKGQTISLRCGESLNPDGSVYMENYYTGPADTYEVYTFGSDEEEEWGPEFMYHGFRYLQIIGLDEAPDPSAFTALRIRSDMENIGRVETSNPLINQIHVLCRDAIASQLYNSITDCPHREKLGWLDVPNEMYVSLNMNYQMQNFYKKVVMDCFDAQQADGHVPSVAPYYMNVYGDDVNWGGAAILVPYRNWKYYGDKSLMTRYYPQMQALLAHYTANTTGYIINDAFSVLSDWGQETAAVSPMVPTGFTETTTYYHLIRVMAEIAAELGHTADAAAYEALAANVKRAFNDRYYDAPTHTYTSVSGGGGRQSEQAQPLYYGLVPEGDEQAVADVLAARVQSDGYKVKSGEIALKCIFMSLARYGHNDIVWQMANQTDCPSYGYWVVQGYTTTPEYWDVGAFSQNHCMMDHIEEWFYTQLGGIQNTGTAFNTFRIAPYIPADLDWADISTACNYGTIRSRWQRTAQGLQFQFAVPAGTRATVVVPSVRGRVLKENGAAIAAGSGGILSVAYGAVETQLVLGSGNYTFVWGE